MRGPVKHMDLMFRTGAAALALAASLWAADAVRADDVPFSISVDGVKIDGSGKVTDAGRKTDVANAEADIQVKFDGLGAAPILNVSTMPVRAAYRAGEEIDFLASSNYPAFIARSEIRILPRSTGINGTPFAILDVSRFGAATWAMPEDAPAEMIYVLRVYDEDGRFDETVPLPLGRETRQLKPHDPSGLATAPGYGEDRTAFRNIHVYGGAVTVYGRNVPAGHDVQAFGEPVPVDPQGGFVIQRILPPGSRTIGVKLFKDGKGLDFSRDVDIPENEWFYVGLADVTAGYRWGDKHIEDVRPGEFDRVYTRGHLAFYLKGKIKGEYLLTAAADTGDQPLKHLLKGLDEKDPRQFLHRIDADDYYPVYGDDSTAIEDAPTRGKFYVRLERGPSHVMWGNFRSNITGSEFLRSTRALYGASGVYRSAKTAANGEARTGADVYAAQPGTVPQRDQFRGTGGSAYFLKHQDVTPGSEEIRIEVRSAATGHVIERRVLTSGDDYDLDHLQGVLLLKQPLPASSLAGTENFVVASYEFTPASGETDGYVLGGRATQWLGDHLRGGVTGLTEKTGKADQKLYGADVRLEATPRTYVTAEIARSEGPGFGSSYSADGGLTIDDDPTAGTTRQATAWRAEGKGDLEDMTGGTVKGQVAAHYAYKQKGFSSLEQDVDDTEREWGAAADAELSTRARLRVAYDEQRIADGRTDRDLRGALRVGVSDHLSLQPEVWVSAKERPAGSTEEDTGKRTDAGLRAIYVWDDRNEAYVFAGTTLQSSGKRDRDDRLGLGGKHQFTEKIDGEGEVSYGTLGVEAKATLGYSPTADDRYYIGYALDAERDTSASWPYDLTGDDLGTIVAGARRRMSDRWSVYGEDNYDMFGERRSLTQAYGVTYTPDAKWTLGGGLEVGHIYDNTRDPDTDEKNPDFDRKALSLSAVYRDPDGIDGKLKGEIRYDDSEDDSRDNRSYLVSAGLGVRMSDDWRALASADVVISEATETTRDSRYAEGSIGFAYRPAEGDRLNALVKYTYLYDLPGEDQVSVDGTTDGPAQRSHIFSIDGSYDLMPQLTLGAKYGLRYGESKDRDPGSEWASSLAQLGILRADFHIVHQWDAMVEGRVLWASDQKTADFGGVVAVYRHINDNIKLGVGYNFGIFSDDLRDLVHDDQGVFVNLIGKL